MTVDAPAAQVWPWLCQLRWAPHSYDWIDNFGPAITNLKSLAGSTTA